VAKTVKKQCSTRFESLFNRTTSFSADATVSEIDCLQRQKRRTRTSLHDSSSKKVRRGGVQCGDGYVSGSGSVSKQIDAVPQSWLQRAVTRFRLQGFVDRAISDAEWKSYFQTRVLLELREAATANLSASRSEIAKREGGVCVEALWPEALGAMPEVAHLCFLSEEESKLAVDALQLIRESVKTTMASSSLKLDPEAVSCGVFLLSSSIHDFGLGEPCTVTASTRIYASNASGHFVDLMYENHEHARSRATEHYSHLYAFKGGLRVMDDEEKYEKKDRREKEHRKDQQGRALIKIFAQDFSENSCKNFAKSSAATKSTLVSLRDHLFGKDVAVSDQMMFDILVSAAGLGKYGEKCFWPVAGS